MTSPQPARAGAAYTPLPEGAVRPCTRCGAPARYVAVPATLEEAEGVRERLCEQCYRECTPGGEISPLDDPATWNPPEGEGEGDPETPEIPAVYVAPPEPNLPDLPQPDAVAGLDETAVTQWVDHLCAAECVRSPGTRYAAGLPETALRAELRADLGDPRVQQGWDQYRDARRRAWELECALPRYEGENRDPALRAEARRLASEGYDAVGIYHGLLDFNQNQCDPPLYEVPTGPDGEIPALQELATETYRNLPLSALRVGAMPEILDANIGGGKLIRNDRRSKRILFVVQTTDREGAVRETPNVVLNAALETATVRVSPRGGITRYECEFVGAPRTTLSVGGTLPEVAGRLVEEGITILPHQLQPALAAIIQTMRERQYCHQTDEDGLPGFYPARYRDPATMTIDLADGIKSVDSRLPPLDRAELRRALTALDDLIKRWFSYSDEARARISTIVKWALVAPFSYVRKHLGIPADYVVLHGTSQTGKSVAGQLTLSVWARNDAQQRKQFGGFNTEARIGESLAESTYPVVVDEVDLGDERLHSILKNAWESLISRQPLTATRQKQPRDALAGALLTTNLGVPVPDGLRNRCAVLTYSLQDRDWTLGNQQEFQREALPQIQQLHHIGAYAWAVVQRTPTILEERSWERLGAEILTGAYRYAGLEVPGWIYDAYEYRIDTATTARTAIAIAFRAYLVREFGQAFPKYRSLFANERGWEGEMWNLSQQLDLLLATGSLAPIHPVRGRGVRVPGSVEEAVATAGNIEQIRIDSGIFGIPEFRDSPEVKQNLHTDLGNLARVLEVERPMYANIQTPDGRRSKRIALTIPKVALIMLIESSTGIEPVEG